MCQTNLRLPTELHEQIKLAASEYKCSQSDVIVDAIRYYFECGRAK